MEVGVGVKVGVWVGRGVLVLVGVLVMVAVEVRVGVFVGEGNCAGTVGLWLWVSQDCRSKGEKAPVIKKRMVKTFFTPVLVFSFEGLYHLIDFSYSLAK